MFFTVEKFQKRVMELNLPPVVVAKNKLLSEKKIVRINSDAVNIDAIKKSETDNCIILRIHECRGGTHNIEISSDFKIRRWASCNLLEQEISEVCESANIRCNMKPFEIKTFKLWW